MSAPAPAPRRFLHRRATSDVGHRRASVVPSFRLFKLPFRAPRPGPDRPLPSLPPFDPYSPRDPSSSDTTTRTATDADSLFTDDASDAPRPRPGRVPASRLAAAHQLILELEALVQQLLAANQALHRRLDACRAAALALAHELLAEKARPTHGAALPASDRAKGAAASPKPSSGDSGLTDILDTFPPPTPPDVRRAAAAARAPTRRQGEEPLQQLEIALNFEQVLPSPSVSGASPPQSRFDSAERARAGPVPRRSPLAHVFEPLELPSNPNSASGSTPPRSPRSPRSTRALAVPGADDGDPHTKIPVLSNFRSSARRSFHATLQKVGSLRRR